MNYKEAIDCLQPVADNTPLSGYGAALTAAIYALHQMERLTELEQADKEGRLVVLPCKIDDPIYLIRGEKEPRKQMKFCVEEYDIDHFTIGGTMIPMITACSKENEWEELIDGTQKGHEYFLTREEAEAALKGEAE